MAQFLGRLVTGNRKMETLHTYMRTEKTSVVLNDLIKINDERVVCYQDVIDCVANIDMDLIYLFKGIIIGGQSFKQQLIKKINPPDSSSISKHTSLTSQGAGQVTFSAACASSY